MSTTPIDSVMLVIEPSITVVQVIEQTTAVVDDTNPADVVEVVGPTVTETIIVEEESVTVVQVAEQGPAGSGLAPFEWPQLTPLAVWTVPHNRGGYPNVTVTDHLKSKLLADVSYLDANTVQITHANPITGYANFS